MHGIGIYTIAIAQPVGWSIPALDIRLVLQQQKGGQDHGPFWSADPQTGMPVVRENSSIEYGFHGWQAGNDDEPEQAYDLVAAFEMNPDYSRV